MIKMDFGTSTEITNEASITLTTTDSNHYPKFKTETANTTPLTKCVSPAENIAINENSKNFHHKSSNDQSSTWINKQAHGFVNTIKLLAKTLLATRFLLG